MNKDSLRNIGTGAALTVFGFGAGIIFDQMGGDEPAPHVADLSTVPGVILPPPLKEGQFLLPRIECQVNQLQENLSKVGEINPDIHDVLATYLAAQNHYEQAGGSLVGSDGQVYSVGNPIGAAENAQKAKDHVSNGFCLAENIPGLSGKFVQDGNVIRYDGQEFNIDNPLQFHVIASILKLELQSKIENTFSFVDRDIIDLEEFTKLPIAIDIEPNAFAIIPSDYMIQTVRMEKLSRSLGLPLVDHIVFKSHQVDDPGAAWYLHEKGLGSTITITNNSTPSVTVTHEFGHHFAALLDESQRTGGMETFGPRYVEERTRLGLTNDFSTAHEASGKFTINPNEEYAEAYRRKVSGTPLDLQDPDSEELAAFESKFFDTVLKNRRFVQGIEVRPLDVSDSITKGMSIAVLAEGVGRIYLGAYYDPTDPTTKILLGISDSLILNVLDKPREATDENGKTITLIHIGSIDQMGRESSIGWVTPEHLVLPR